MGELTGFKVLMIAVTAFGVIIGVNVLMAYQAVRTFPGLEVKNSYQASQEFDARKTAQVALGWQVRTRYDGAVLEIEITGRDGGPAEIAAMTALVGWATSTQDDVTPSFTRNGAVYATPLTLPDGNWYIHLRAQAPDGTEFYQRIPLRVYQGKA